MKIDFTKEELDIIKKVLKNGMSIPFVEYNGIMEKIEQQPVDNGVWADIMNKAIGGEHGLMATVDTFELRKILEKYKILKQEKGM